MWYMLLYIVNICYIEYIFVYACICIKRCCIRIIHTKVWESGSSEPLRDGASLKEDAC